MKKQYAEQAHQQDQIADRGSLVASDEAQEACHPERAAGGREGSPTREPEQNAQRSSTDSEPQTPNSELVVSWSPSDDDNFETHNELLAAFAASDENQEFDLTLIVAFLEEADDQSLDINKMSTSDVTRIAQNLLSDHKDTAEDLLATVAMFWAWLADTRHLAPPDETVEGVLSLTRHRLQRAVRASKRAV